MTTEPARDLSATLADRITAERGQEMKVLYAAAGVDAPGVFAERDAGWLTQQDVDNEPLARRDDAFRSSAPAAALYDQSRALSEAFEPAIGERTLQEWQQFEAAQADVWERLYEVVKGDPSVPVWAAVAAADVAAHYRTHAGMTARQIARLDWLK